MSQQNKLRAVIDRMVEDSIRRILPKVMNEVLLRTIADSGVLSESRERTPRHVRKKPGPKPKLKQRRDMAEQRQARPQKPVQQRPRRVELNDLLDESAGAEFYEDPRIRQAKAKQEEYEVEIDLHEEEEREAALVDPRAMLNPALRSLAEDIEVSDEDDGGMWQPGEHDAVAVVPDLPPVKDLDRAAKAVGIDFSRMASTIAKTSPTAKVDPQDVRNRAMFEERRLKAMRESLNGGKPVG